MTREDKRLFLEQVDEEIEKISEEYLLPILNFKLQLLKEPTE